MGNATRGDDVRHGTGQERGDQMRGDRMDRGILRLACVLYAFPAMVRAQPSSTPVPSREYIIGRIADLRKISTPEGIEALEEVSIGGSRQWISIRGLNRANP